jgi:hypothetical protein
LKIPKSYPLRSRKDIGIGLYIDPVAKIFEGHPATLLSLNLKPNKPMHSDSFENFFLYAKLFKKFYARSCPTQSSSALRSSCFQLRPTSNQIVTGQLSDDDQIKLFSGPRFGNDLVFRFVQRCATWLAHLGPCKPQTPLTKKEK